MIHRLLRAAPAALALSLALSVPATLAAQATSPQAAAPPAAEMPAGPRRAPVIRPLEVRLANETAAPVPRHKDTTVITISTLGLVLILVLLIILIA